MAQQNINQYVYPKLRLNIVNDCEDMSLASDEVDYNQEVVFSPYLIAQTYGDKLPISININNPLTVQDLTLTYKNYNENNVFVSQNYYNPENKDLTCFSSSTACDIGLTGIDNGLVTSMVGETINFTNGLYDDFLKFNRTYFDRRFKMFQVTGYTSQNERFSGLPDTTLYEVVSKVGPVGKYHELYGGFYQGFYKLFGYDYDIMPERMNKGWSVEMILKPRLVNEYTPGPGETTLNLMYPQNKDTFFYFGTRAENKFYHHADGTPNCFTGYTRVTNGLEECIETCACCDTGITNSRCIYVYPPRSKNNQHDPHLNYGCNLCGGIQEKQLTCGCSCGEQSCETCGWECFDHTSTCPSTPPTFAFQICNSNGEIDDNFEVILNGTSIGELIFTSNTISGSIFIADSTSGVTFNSYPFDCPISGMTIYYFNPDLINEGNNEILMSNIQNNDNGNFGTINGFTFKNINSTLFSPNEILNDVFSGNSGLNFSFNFDYYLTPQPTPTPTPSPTPTCDTPTPVCTPTCTTCTTCDTCVSCAPTGSTSIQSTCETDPLYDAMSNAISFRLCGDPENPQIGVKVLRMTGQCETTGTCVTGQTYVTGYTIDEYCSPPIYPYCLLVNPAYLLEEHWFQVDAVWERYTWLDTCDLKYRGGLSDITKFEYLNSLANDTVSLIAPPYTNNQSVAGQVELVNLNQSWLNDVNFRMGRLKIYVNGKIHYTIENFEEIIPRGLNTDKEKQLGVPFNISWGGGTQGLHENLTFSACSATTGQYIQDPECFPNNILSGTSLSGLHTNIIIEQNFAGTFDGGISQFRMYTTPLSAPEVKHNFLLLKDSFDMFNPDCPDCSTTTCLPNDFTYVLVDIEFLITQQGFFIMAQNGNNIVI